MKTFYLLTVLLGGAGGELQLVDSASTELECIKMAIYYDERYNKQFPRNETQDLSVDDNGKVIKPLREYKCYSADLKEINYSIISK